MSQFEGQLTSKDDLLEFLDKKVQEGKLVDYKQNLKIELPSEKKEFLADFTSFANTEGGWLIIGIEEGKDEKGKQNGLPDCATGFKCDNQDRLKLDLENIIRDGIQPRLNTHDIYFIDGFEKGPCLTIRVKKSLDSPHMVTLGGTNKYYMRNSAGKYQLDARQVEVEYDKKRDLKEIPKNVIAERTQKATTRIFPVDLVNRPFLQLLVLPIEFLCHRKNLDADILRKNPIAPMISDGFSYSLDHHGYHYYYGIDNEIFSFVTVHFSGLIEAIETQFFDHPMKNQIPAMYLHCKIIDKTK